MLRLGDFPALDAAMDAGAAPLKQGAAEADFLAEALQHLKIGEGRGQTQRGPDTAQRTRLQLCALAQLQPRVAPLCRATSAAIVHTCDACVARACQASRTASPTLPTCWWRACRSSACPRLAWSLRRCGALAHVLLAAPHGAHCPHVPYEHTRNETQHTCASWAAMVVSFPHRRTHPGGCPPRPCFTPRPCCAQAVCDLVRAKTGASPLMTWAFPQQEAVAVLMETVDVAFQVL